MPDGLQLQAETIFQEALQLTPGEREAYLSRRCGSDLALRTEVESLLAAYDDSDDLEQRFERQAGHTLHESRAIMPPRIGRYKLLEPIGEGGMGVVYRAQQDRPDRTVALKLIRQGFATSRLQRRFELEAETLGRLQHAGIAQIFEAGTAEIGGANQPFFAMEWVDGTPLLKYAEQHKLELSARLELLVRTCAAVQHAHQKGVVHRDLKPENILVNRDGHPKVLDFGVARVSDPDDHNATAVTREGQLLGTIPYMSPEQVSGQTDAIDTRTDVYALGVVLHQLLTGRLPHKLDGLSLPQMIQAITDNDAVPNLATLSDLPRDVAIILGKALARDRDQRYASAAALGDDLQRYLSHEPIEARPATTWYRLGRFARRNLLLVGSLVLVFVATVGGAAAATLGWMEAHAQTERARQAQVRAEDEATRAETVVGFFEDMLLTIRPQEDREYDVTVAELLDQAAADLVQLEQDPEVSAALHLTIGKTYNGLGQPDKAEPHLNEAASLYETLRGPDDPASLDTRFELVRLRELAGDYAGAEQPARDLLSDYLRVSGPDHRGTLQAQRELVRVLQELHQYDEAEQLLRDAYDRLQKTVGPNDMETIDAALSLASLREDRGYNAEAAELYRFAVDHYETQAPHVHQLAKSALGTTLRDMGRYAEAEPLLREVLATRTERFGRQHPSTLVALNNLGSLLAKTGQFEEAETLLQESLTLRQAVHGPEHPGTLRGWHALGLLAAEKRDYAGAIELLAPIVEPRRELLGPGAPATLSTLAVLSTAYYATGQRDEAFTMLEEGLTAGRAAIGPEDPRVLQLQARLAFYYKRAKRYDEAEKLYRHAYETRQALHGPLHEQTISVQYNLGRLYQDTRRWDEAETHLRGALDARLEMHRPFDRRIGHIQHALAVMYRSQKRYEDALPLHEDFYELERHNRPDHLERWNALSNLAYANMKLERYEAAVPQLLDAAVEIEKRMPDHWWAALQYVLLGECQAAVQQPDEAEKSLLHGLEIANQSAGGNARSQSRRALRALVKLCREQDRAAEADRYQADLDAITEDD